MDNLCHTLAGLAVGETGLKQKTALASATLMIGANLPDVDGFIYFIRPELAFAFRRGWTHGILAMAVWPFVLTGLMLLIGRLTKDKPNARGLLLLSAVAIWSHPLLDLMNTYGVRLLMPFSERWFYGDTLFIVDPWILLALILGIVLARRAQKRGSAHPFRPMRVALVACGFYLAGMATIGLAGRRAALREMHRRRLEVSRLMVAPVPLTPFIRQVTATSGDIQIWSMLYLGLRGFRYEEVERYPVNDETPEARAARSQPPALRFLRWARFPYFLDDAQCPAAHACIYDLRYPWQGWASVAVPVGRGISSPASPRDPEQP